MSEPGRHPGSGRIETDLERVDRNLLELLGELRVALPGVQVLFAFLLVVPFNRRFEEVTAFQEKVYFGTLLCTTAAAILLIAPSVHHRLTFRQQETERVVTVGNKLVLIGLAVLAVAMMGVVVLVTDFLFSATATLIVGVGAGLAFAFVWFGIPSRGKLTRGTG